MSTVMTLEEFNTLPVAAAAKVVAGWLHCEWWVQQVIGHRPYASIEAVATAATEFWRQTTPSQQREAFAAHPMIGDVDVLRRRFAAAGSGQTDTAADRAQREQGQVLAASDAVLERLAEGNRAYHERHGFIFIICATGLSADTMLAALEERLPNDTAVELLIAAGEQERIMQLRLAATFGTPLEPR